MSPQAQRILEQAMELSADDREQIAVRLYDALHANGFAPEVEEAWAEVHVVAPTVRRTGWGRGM